jgi:hypothetical protein
MLSSFENRFFYGDFGLSWLLTTKFTWVGLGGISFEVCFLFVSLSDCWNRLFAC